jgi:hypothetical protein
VSIMLMPKDDRLTQEQKSLNAFLRELKFFKSRKMKDRDIADICDRLKIAHSVKTTYEVIFGDKGDLFFIILKGNCSVWVPIPD